MFTRRHILAGLGASALALAAKPGRAAAPTTIRIGFGATVPTMIVLKQNGWIEEQLRPRGIAVQWVQTFGSNQTMEFIRSGSIDMGPSAGSAALLARANGTPVKIVYWQSRGESTALVTLPDSPIRTIADLKGRTIAATRGTEPFIFLQRALAKNGIPASQVQVVPLQHPDGRAALEAHRVDAWAGLDPDLSIVQVRRQARFFHRDATLITGGVLNAAESFGRANPDLVQLVIKGHEWARAFIHANPDKALALYASQGNLDPEIAAAAFRRNDFDHPAITPADYASIEESGQVLKTLDLIPDDTDLHAATQALLDPDVYQAVLAAK